MPYFTRQFYQKDFSTGLIRVEQAPLRYYFKLRVVLIITGLNLLCCKISIISSFQDHWVVVMLLASLRIELIRGRQMTYANVYLFLAPYLLSNIYVYLPFFFNLFFHYYKTTNKNKLISALSNSLHTCTLVTILFRCLSE